MNTTPFRTGGALTDDHTDIYIERQADREALTHLRRMDYLLTIEPRQQGKTSLINHLMCHPGLENVTFVYLDVTTPDRSSEAAWYQTLCPRILRQSRGFIPRSQRPPIPQKSAGWREFLCEVAICAADAHKRVVIALDEIGAVTFPGATDFFSVLRDVYNSRQAETELKQLTFLLAGAFHPRDLIQDDKISPFNIAQRVRLDDFTLQQVKELVGKGSWAKEQADALAERVHYWTDGQPYLTQLLCSYLEPDATPTDVDTGVNRLRREDENHLPPLIDRLERDEKLSQYVKRILSGEHVKFYPREHRRQADLELLGVIKEGAGGFCVVRNRLYRQVLLETFAPRSDRIPPSYSVPDLERLYSLRINASFDEVWSCLVYTRDQKDSYWAKQERLWWSVDETEHSKSTKSATLLLGINRPDADSIYDFNERRLHLFQGAEGWTVIEVHADPVVESQSDPKATEIFEDFLDDFEQMFIRLRYKMVKMNNEANDTEGTTHPKPKFASHPELNEALTRRNLALFIGADLPRKITGLPSRADLARELARRKGRARSRVDTSLSLAEVAQRVARGGNRWDFTAFIRDQLDTTGKSPQPFHRRIVEMVQEHEIKTLITTAYDNLLELAFQEVGIPINRVVRGSDVSFIAHDRPTLIKLYGDIQQPNTLVVTEDDHYDLWRDRDKEDLLHEVRTVLRRQTVLFLGYNLADPDVNLLWREVLDRAGRFNRTAYAVWPGLPEGEVRMWRDRGILILDEDPLGVLSGLDAPSAPARRPEPEVDAPKSESSVKGNDMDYERGLDALKQFAEGTDWYQDFAVYEAPLRENLRDERRYGPSEQTRRDRTRIVDQLNALALKHLGISFNDLCMGKQPPSSAAEAKGDGTPADPEQLYGTGNPWAVLVGVNEYEDSANYGELQVCVKDVEAVHEQLVAGGFDPARIRLLTDHTDELPTRANILTALKAVADATEPGDLLLFYYSGHGEEDGGESYLIARDGRRLVLSDTAVPLSRVKEIVEEAPARAKVIVLDACHSGADIGGKGPQPMSEAFIRRVFEQAEGMAILASCKQGQLSYEWRDNERSVFTHFLLEALAGAADRDEKGFVTVQDASRHVTNGVKLWASQRNTSQIPTLQYTVAGDIILVRYQ
jgi:hypothetical protein